LIDQQFAEDVRRDADWTLPYRPRFVDMCQSDP
jgi:hypothetical protein